MPQRREHWVFCDALILSLYGLRYPRLQLRTSDRLGHSVTRERHTQDCHDCSVLGLLLGAPSGERPTQKREMCALLSLSPIGRRIGACGGVPVPAPAPPVPAPAQPVPAPAQPVPAAAPLSTASAGTNTVALRATHTPRAPSTVPSWPRCLKVFVEVLDGAQLGVRAASERACVAQAGSRRGNGGMAR